MLPYSALLAVVIPGFVGLGLLAFRRNVTDRAGWIATAATLISVFLMLNMATDVLDNYNQDQSPLLFEYSWIKPINVSFGFIVDVVNLPLGLIVALVSTLTCFYSIQYMAGEKDLPAYYASLLLFMMGMMGVMLSNNLIQFYLFWELMLIPSYLLIALWGTSENRLRIGFKYFIFTHVGALSMLLGILAIYSYTGTFDLVSLPQLIHLIPPEMVNVIFVLLGFGFFVKMAVFPVHTWLPDAHSEAPTPISAMLSGLMVKSGAYGIARVLLGIFGSTMTFAADFLTILAVITIAYGGLMALAQTDIKRLLAYSSISQLGYILFGLGTASSLGVTGGLLHMVNHAVSKSLLFLCAGILIHETKTRDISQLGGLMSRMPVTSAACVIGAFSLIGIPPLNGFWSEWMIFGGGLSADKIVITFIGVASTLVTAGYYLWFVWRVFFGTPSPLVEANNVDDPSVLQLTPIVILATLCLVWGLFPGSMLIFIRSAAELLTGIGG
ncbi:MAG: NADH-quinone oxidoreductase subunit M [Candidatus Bathyarchaeota archaeon]|nr:NADH-quinone oxidoreductase subunit M [Candidatus Bathyarchaeota archaeon]